MTPVQANAARSNPSRVSILARLVPACSYAIPMLGAAMSAFLLMGVMRAMRMAESAGIAAVAGGMSEASFSTAVALYLAIFVGVIGILVVVIRLLMTTKTASPSGWFYLIAGGLGWVPLALSWYADALLVQSIAGRRGVVEVASTIQLCLVLTPISAAAFGLILLVASVVPLPSVLRAKRNWAPILVVLLMELALIAMAVGFQMHTSWLHQARIRESF